MAGDERGDDGSQWVWAMDRYGSQSKSRGATVNCSCLTPTSVLPEKQLKRILKQLRVLAGGVQPMHASAICW